MERKAQEKTGKAEELVEGVEGEAKEVVTERINQVETSDSNLLGLEEGTPQSLGVMLAKVVAVSSGVFTRTLLCESSLHCGLCICMI